MAFAHPVLVAQWPADPAPQQPAAHRGRGAVEQPGQAVLTFAGGGLDQFKISARGGVDDDAVRVIVDLQTRDVRQGAALGI